MAKTYHLKFWGKTCGSTEIHRIYVNADDRSSLGYFEMRVGLAARRSGSQYDNHRLAKGDTTVETGRAYSCTLTAEIEAAIYAAPSIANRIEEYKSGDDFARFSGLLDHARGTNAIYYSKVQAAAVKKLAKFTIEF